MDNLIKEKRIERGLTMKELADAVGVSEATVSRWESGHIANMKHTRIEALAKALRVSPLDIINIDDTETENERLARTLVAAFEDRPEMRMLFSVASDCTAEEIENAVKIIEALKK